MKQYWTRELMLRSGSRSFFFFQAEDGIRDLTVTGVQTCALPICMSSERGTRTEIVAVGRELLTGRTVDTNSAWIAARLVALGACVARIVAVDDEIGRASCRERV